jgi:erythromycin esterase
MSFKPNIRCGYLLLELLVCQVLFSQAYPAAARQENRPNAPRSTAPREVIDWFRSTAIPLKTTSPDASLEDMNPLLSVVGDARIVAMGEATHGTRQFFEMKHRMLEFLAEKMGFTVFAIEANWPEALAVNDYVLHGKGDPAAALAGMYFWTWNTEEVLDMIRWMRRYNENPGHIRKLKFLGFDMQTARVAVSNVEEYLEKVDPEESRFARNVLAPLADERSEAEYAAKPRPLRMETAQGVKTLLARFINRKQEYAEASSEDDWVVAQHNLEIIRQAEELRSSRVWGIRDRYMAENVKWILDHEPPGTKMMLWAHNGHVSTAPWAMGRLLRLLYRQAMVVCGFSFSEGSFRARGVPKRQHLRYFSVGPPPANTLDSALADTGLGLFAIDLRGAPDAGVVPEWLHAFHPMRMIGSVYNELAPNAYFPAIRPDSFDVIFFVNKTSPARENRERPREMETDFKRG